MRNADVGKPCFMPGQEGRIGILARLGPQDAILADSHRVRFRRGIEETDRHAADACSHVHAAHGGALVAAGVVFLAEGDAADAAGDVVDAAGDGVGRARGAAAARAFCGRAVVGEDAAVAGGRVGGGETAKDGQRQRGAGRES